MNNSDNNSTTNTLVNIGAGYSQFKAVMSFGVSCIIFIIMTYFGYTLYNTSDVYGDNKIKGTIKDCNCKTTRDSKDSKTIQYDCSFNILYNIDNTNYQKHMDTYSNNNYSNGQIINLRYNNNDKNDITLNTVSYKSWGIVLIVIGLFILIGSGIYLYVLLKYKNVAAGAAAMDIVSTAAGARQQGVASSISTGISAAVVNKAMGL